MQFHHCLTQLVALKLIIILIIVFGSEFMHFRPSIDQQTFNFFNLVPDLVNFNPYIHAPFSVWFLVLDFFNQVLNWLSNFNI